jgi:hypothetical protein
VGFRFDGPTFARPVNGHFVVLNPLRSSNKSGIDNELIVLLAH